LCVNPRKLVKIGGIGDTQAGCLSVGLTCT
jgi:hypothetical protein